MVHVLLSGCCGAMGKAVTALTTERDDIIISAGVDIASNAALNYPIYRSFTECDSSCDVIVDFSTPDALPSLLDYAIAKKMPCVLCATGYTEEQLGMINNAGKNIPIFFSANMSIGINVLCALAKAAAKMIGSGFDIEIIESHHHNKVDAPSGTALMLAGSIASQLEETPFYQFDRHSIRKKRDVHEIGIHSIRGGTITGEHEIIFAGNNEVLTLKHSAQSKSVFASGAINAAIFIVGRSAGLYDMNDMIKY